MFAALVSVVSVGAALALGLIATAPNIPGWYEGLAKPAFTPPNWLFGPAWTVLYILMAIAAWRVLRLPAPTPWRSLGLSLFFLQLALNVGWSWLFFACHSPALGVADIVPQLIAILGTIAVFWRLDLPAAWCLVPLACWVGFATILNIAIWRMNA